MKLGKLEIGFGLVPSCPLVPGKVDKVICRGVYRDVFGHFCCLSPSPSKSTSCGTGSKDLHQSKMPSGHSAQENAVLDTQAPPSASSGNQQSYTYYHAGPLFTIADLHTNVLLSKAINQHSASKFLPVLPQDLEQRGNVTPQNIRDKDIRALLSCDLALFTYDGSELDSGTVVEFMIAKMTDVPAVILRSDFRGGGDQSGGQPWNLMSSFWPRTEAVVVDAMLGYKQSLADGVGSAGETLIETTAKQCVAAMEEALKKPSRMPKELRESVYRWIALMPGYAEGEDQKDVAETLQLLQAKEQKGLFK